MGGADTTEVNGLVAAFSLLSPWRRPPDKRASCPRVSVGPLHDLHVGAHVKSDMNMESVCSSENSAKHGGVGGAGMMQQKLRQDSVFLVKHQKSASTNRRPEHQATGSQTVQIPTVGVRLFTRSP